MINPVATFLFTATGAFAIWLTKGFKGPFDNEMVRIHERHSTKGTTRYLLGMGIWIVIVVIISIALTRPTETKAYKARVNDKGEIELEEIK
jgi:hypothetical protein